MKRLLLFVSSLLFCACINLQEYHYFVSLVLNNQTGYDIEIFKDDEYHATMKNGNYCEIFRGNCPYDIEGISIEPLLLQTNKISFWKIEGNSIKFLKEWTYEDRDNDGKQLFRLSEHRYTIKQKDNLMLVSFKFHITDEDFQK